MDFNYFVMVKFIAAFNIIVAVMLFFWKRTAAFPIVIFLLIIGGGALFYGLVFLQDEMQNNRYISKDEARAAKMFQQNCKQVDYIQSNETTGLGIGMTGKGSPVLGTISSSNEDSYFYMCDEGVKYNLTYDIEKYRKFYS